MEVAVVQQDAMVVHALEPSGDGGLGMASVADHDGDVDAFGHQPEDHLDAVGCCLEIVERGVASAGEIGSAPLAAEMLEVSLDAAFAVAHEGMYLVIGDAEEVAKRIETGKTDSLLISDKGGKFMNCIVRVVTAQGGILSNLACRDLLMVIRSF